MPSESEPTKPRRALRLIGLVSIYAVFVTGWILFSDDVLTWMTSDPKQLVLLGTVNDGLFIALTTLGFYLLLRRAVRKAPTVRSAASSSVVSPQMSWLSPWLFGLLSLAILALTATAIVHSIEAERATGVARLQTIADLKTSQIADWLSERRADAAFVQSSTEDAEQYARWQQGDAASGARLQARLRRFVRDQGFTAVTLLDPEGRLLWRSPKAPEDFGPALRAGLRAAQLGQAQRVGFYLGRAGEVRLDFVTTLAAATPAPLVILHLEPAAWLSAVLRTWPVPTKTGEARLLRRDDDQALILSAARGDREPAAARVLPLPGARLLVADVLRGERPLGRAVSGRNARGTPVVGVAAAVGGTDWLLLAQIERAELDAGAMAQSFWIALAGALALILSGATLWLTRQRLHAQSLLHTLAEGSPDAIFAKDRSGRYVLLNHAASALLGRPVKEVLGRDDAVLFPSTQAADSRTRARQVMAERRVLSSEESIGGPEDRRDFQVLEGPLCDPDGRVIGSFGIARDITELARAASARAESEGRLRLLIDHAPAALAMFDREMRYLVVSQRWLIDYGLEGRDLLGQCHYDIFPEIPERWKVVHAQCMADDVIRAEEDRFERQDGSVQWLRWEVRPWHLASGAIGGIVIFTEDTTVRKQAEVALRRFELLAAHTRDILLFMRREDGRLLEVNEAAVQAYGYSREELLTLCIHDLRAPQTAGQVESQMAAAGAEGLLFETLHRRRDGRTFPVEVSSQGALIDDTATLISLIRDITERKRAEDLLRDADHRKDTFLATLAHELRNPLAPIRSAVTILQQLLPPEPRSRVAMDMIERQVRHMVRLIDDLLDVSRITRGHLELRRERVGLGQVLEEAVAAAQPYVDQGRHQLELELPSVPIELDADPVRLAQVFTNLIHNACKYSDPEGKIRVVAASFGGEVVVRVRDKGVGIAAEDLDRMFQMFAQVGPRQGRVQGGLGIGLALARALIDMHGGRIEARSEGLGHGSELGVWLPLPVSARRPEPEAAPAAVAAPEPQPALSRPVLVVDDNADSADSLAILLRLKGYAVETAYDGEEALEVAERQRPAVIFLDIGLPKLDGYGVCRQLRGTPWGSQMRVYAMTGWGQDEDRRKSQAAGFDGHLVKPIDNAAVMAILAESAA